MRISPKMLAEALKLTRVNSCPGEDSLSITVPEIFRPGLQFAGYFSIFPNERVQLIGKTELAYLESLEPVVAESRLARYFSEPLPCIIIGRGMECPPILLRHAERTSVPIYTLNVPTSVIAARAMLYLSEVFAPRQTLHGVLMEVFGQGVLITGDSGVGKSECALELLNHGHLLVADDVVDVFRVGDNLYGESPEMIRDFMELRGVGIIDVKKIYGIGAVLKRKTLNLIIHIEFWDASKTYDRLGNTENTREILGVRVPLLEVPVRPGRSLATIVEIAARNYSLRAEGYRAAEELDRRLRTRYSVPQDKPETERRQG